MSPACLAGKLLGGVAAPVPVAPSSGLPWAGRTKRTLLCDCSPEVEGWAAVSSASLACDLEQVIFPFYDKDGSIP